jgi:hypothetical protein
MFAIDRDRTLQQSKTKSKRTLKPASGEECVSPVHIELVFFFFFFNGIQYLEELQQNPKGI